ncbi:MAG: hypothetical protein AAFR90_11960 [Pseudomonadota bacterium]
MHGRSTLITVAVGQQPIEIEDVVPEGIGNVGLAVGAQDVEGKAAGADFRRASVETVKEIPTLSCFSGMIPPMMKRRYKTGTVRDQISMLPSRIENYVSENAPFRAIDVYVDTLYLKALGFCYRDGGHAKGNGQPPYDPGDHLNLEVIWLAHAA